MDKDCLQILLFSKQLCHSCRLELVEKTTEKAVVKSGDNKVEIYANPFKVDVYRGKELLISTNARGLMRFEHFRTKPAP